MANKEDLRPVRPFSIAVSALVKGLMSENDVTQAAVAKELKRDQSYVSERVTGRRAFTTDELDAISSLIGISGRDILLIVADRLKRLDVSPSTDNEVLATVTQLGRRESKSISTAEKAALSKETEQ